MRVHVCGATFVSKRRCIGGTGGRHHDSTQGDLRRSNSSRWMVWEFGDPELFRWSSAVVALGLVAQAHAQDRIRPIVERIVPAVCAWVSQLGTTDGSWHIQVHQAHPRDA